MRHTKPFPSFADDELDDLRKKIVHGVIESDTAAMAIDPEHFKAAYYGGKAWVNYPCWLSASKWTDGKGFKKIKFKGHTLYIHRASHELFNGPVDLTQVVDHLCRVRGCCQPLHLEAVPPIENILRGANQNVLLRSSDAPPLTAKEINPRFFEVPSGSESDAEYWRRKNEGRDIPRHWDDDQGNPPTPPEGFRWERSAGFGTVGYILNPIRDGIDSVRVVIPDLPLTDEEILQPCNMQPGGFTPVDRGDGWARRAWARIKDWLNKEVWR